MTKNEMAFAVAEFDMIQHGDGDLNRAAQDIQAAYDAADETGRRYLFETVLMFFKSNLDSNRHRDRLPPCVLAPQSCRQGSAAHR